ncbi:hypothetical protein [Bacillus sp. ISL-37]|uniref:hypothetical protein n=1 Tax=Bacillus sp. ISL-37 TaxID=2819123 RepID=UPI001BE7D00E|nr:hypothetical protein [Bacillus sp. ISL-37]
MKSFFDFIGRTEATRGVRRWIWTFLEVKFILSNPLKQKKPLKSELCPRLRTV